MNTKNPVKVAVIGCGGISRAHLRSYAAIPRAQIVAVSDPVRSAAEGRAAEYKVPYYTDYRKLLAKEDVAAISVCTPPAYHREITEAAVKRGLHVLCEKPLATSIAEGEAMVAAAKKARVVLITGFCHRFHNPVVKAKAWISEGRLGPLHQIRLRWGQVSNMEGKWFGDPAQGGGLFWESAAHSVDMFRYLAGEVKDVYAKGATRGQKIPGADTVLILVEGVNGTLGVLEGSWSSPFSENRIEIHGEMGAIVVDYNSNHSRYSVANATEWLDSVEPKYDRFHQEISHFLDCVQGLAKPIVTGEDGVQSMRLIDAALRSAKDGVRVSFESPRRSKR